MGVTTIGIRFALPQPLPNLKSGLADFHEHYRGNLADLRAALNDKGGGRMPDRAALARHLESLGAVASRATRLAGDYINIAWQTGTDREMSPHAGEYLRLVNTARNTLISGDGASGCSLLTDEQFAALHACLLDENFVAGLTPDAVRELTNLCSAAPPEIRYRASLENLLRITTGPQVSNPDAVRTALDALERTTLTAAGAGEQFRTICAELLRGKNREDLVGLWQALALADPASIRRETRIMLDETSTVLLARAGEQLAAAATVPFIGTRQVPASGETGPEGLGAGMSAYEKALIPMYSSRIDDWLAQVMEAAAVKASAQRTSSPQGLHEKAVMLLEQHREALMSLYPVWPTDSHVLGQVLNARFAHATGNERSLLEALQRCHRVEWVDATDAEVAALNQEFDRLTTENKSTAHSADRRLPHGFVADFGSMKTSVELGETRVIAGTETFRHRDVSDLDNTRELITTLVRNIDLREDARFPAQFAPKDPPEEDSNLDGTRLRPLLEIDQRALGMIPEQNENAVNASTSGAYGFTQHLRMLTVTDGARAMPEQREWHYSDGPNGEHDVTVAQFFHHIPNIGNPASGGHPLPLKDGHVGWILSFRSTAAGPHIIAARKACHVEPLTHPDTRHQVALQVREHFLSPQRPDLFDTAPPLASDPASEKRAISLINSIFGGFCLPRQRSSQSAPSIQSRVLSPPISATDAHRHARKINDLPSGERIDLVARPLATLAELTQVQQQALCAAIGSSHVAAGGSGQLESVKILLGDVASDLCALHNDVAPSYREELAELASGRLSSTEIDELDAALRICHVQLIISSDGVLTRVGAFFDGSRIEDLKQVYTSVLGGGGHAFEAARRAGQLFASLVSGQRYVMFDRIMGYSMGGMTAQVFRAAMESHLPVDAGSALLPRMIILDPLLPNNWQARMAAEGGQRQVDFGKPRGVIFTLDFTQKSVPPLVQHLVKTFGYTHPGLVRVDLGLLPVDGYEGLPPQPTSALGYHDDMDMFGRVIKRFAGIPEDIPSVPAGFASWGLQFQRGWAIDELGESGHGYDGLPH